MKRGFFVFLTITVICLLAGVSSVLASWPSVENEGEATSSVLLTGTKSIQDCDAVSDGKNLTGRRLSFGAHSKGLEDSSYSPSTGTFPTS